MGFMLIYEGPPSIFPKDDFQGCLQFPTKPVPVNPEIWFGGVQDETGEPGRSGLAKASTLLGGSH